MRAEAPQVNATAAEYVLERFRKPGRIPRDAISVALEDWDAVAPGLLELLERCATADATTLNAAEPEEALVVVLHVLAQQRDARAYRPLLAFLRKPRDIVKAHLGDTTTESLHRVLASVYDGDPAPLETAILDAEVAGYARNALLKALASLTADGHVPLERAGAFLERCWRDPPQQEEPELFWLGWQEAVSRAGLSELSPQVRDLFRTGAIDDHFMSWEDFKEDLAEGLRARQEGNAASVLGPLYLDDAAEELRRWPSFQSPEERRIAKRRADRAFEALMRAHEEAPPTRENPWRHVGRNDPCPCGSGRKYKKCCLSARAAGVPSSFPP